MSRRRVLIPVRACNIKFKRGGPWQYQYYFRGYRSWPAKMWTIEVSGPRWSISAPGEEPKYVATLREAREHIASKYQAAYN